MKISIDLSTVPAAPDNVLPAPELRETAPVKVRPFPLTQVKLLDGPFKHARALNEQYLLSLEPDRRYWGSDAGREFEILVDGRKIATEKLMGEKPDEFIDREYLIPDDLLKGRDQVTVRFQPVGQSQAGRVFGCYIMKEQ